MSDKPIIWTPTDNGFSHYKLDYTLVNEVDNGLLSIGGVWRLYHGKKEIATRFYKDTLCLLRLHKWANRQIRFHLTGKEEA